jgi:hypothetical protein
MKIELIVSKAQPNYVTSIKLKIQTSFFILLLILLKICYFTKNLTHFYFRFLK